MGQAKQRGTFEERRAQSIASGSGVARRYARHSLSAQLIYHRKRRKSPAGISVLAATLAALSRK
jgi:hypothetical protein